MHLFDIDVPGKITFRESDILSPGDQFATFDTGKPAMRCVEIMLIGPQALPITLPKPHPSLSGVCGGACCLPVQCGCVGVWVCTCAVVPGVSNKTMVNTVVNML